MASVKVAVRVRPFNGRERQLASRLVVGMVGDQVTLQPVQEDPKSTSSLHGDKHKPHNFAFDHAYWSHDPGDKQFVAQDKVFTDLGQDVVKNAFDGYNVCVFAYGQTGSGKTYTMMGSESDRGLIPRICETMFQRMVEGTSYRTEVSYLEIYNERVKDLLQKNSSHNLKVREHPVQGPYVQDLSKHLVMEYKEILRLMEQGNDLRTTAATNMNDTSSRSHAIFTITFVQAGYLAGMPHETESKIHLVDLAGSERANATGATGQRLKEGAHINKSLVTLGSVISALAEASNKQNSAKHFIPYRDSVLTWLLKDSLGGNSKTIMIATISPAEVNHNETLSTLRYANRAKNIINKPTVNEDPNVKLIRELREEIDRMKAIMSGDPVMLAAVQEQLAVKEAKEQKLVEAWNDKWREAAKILQEHNALGLKRTGLGVVLDSDKPHLIGLDEDILSTGITLYQLREGTTIIGNTESEECPHIVLKGPSILPLHCSIKLNGGVSWLHPSPGALCLVNASPVEAPVRLSQGCVIVLGKTNMFRYNDPMEAADLRKNMSEKNRKASLLNQSLMSQSLSDLRNPPGSRHSGEWPRMFASDSDIKDIAEGIEGDGPASLLAGTLGPHKGSEESVCTIMNQVGSGASTVNTTPRRQKDVEELNLTEESPGPSFPSPLTDVNANPRVSHSTPQMPKHGEMYKEIESVSPMSERVSGEGSQGMSQNMITSSLSGCSSQTSSIQLSQLYQDICDQKDVIMSCLEEDNCDIDQLNAEIAKLQSMQHKYSLIEFESTKSLWLHQSGDDSSFYQDKFAQMIEAEVDRRLEAEAELRTERERQERELLLLEKEQELERLRVQHEREMYLIKKKLSVVNSPPPSSAPPSNPLNISIPRYHTVGSGKISFTEYEVVVVEVVGEEQISWTLFRRYRQFRDLHSSLCSKYGSPVTSLAFPARKLFGSRSDAVSSERQRELQVYLNKLVSTCTKISSCPLHLGHSRENLAAFATFFQTNNAATTETR
eukprot:GFUD01024866.1.p1 GENE.GFUD01024866.1~~GFUD01024866.1.p1  ORF type:complete len:1003 (-),score=283.83 GFUD01024866.1:228-3236(-)